MRLSGRNPSGPRLASSRSGYHNKEWALLMRAVGLVASDTGAPGGREVGQQLSHYIEEGGAFARACAELVAQGFDPLYVELWTEGGEATRRQKAASKTKYTCPGCAANAWAKPDMHPVGCGPSKIGGAFEGERTGRRARSPDLCPWARPRPARLSTPLY